MGKSDLKEWAKHWRSHHPSGARLPMNTRNWYRHLPVHSPDCSGAHREIGSRAKLLYRLERLHDAPLDRHDTWSTPEHVCILGNKIPVHKVDSQLVTCSQSGKISAKERHHDARLGRHGSGSPPEHVRDILGGKLRKLDSKIASQSARIDTSSATRMLKSTPRPHQKEGMMRMSCDYVTVLHVI